MRPTNNGGFTLNKQQRRGSNPRPSDREASTLPPRHGSTIKTYEITKDRRREGTERNDYPDVCIIQMDLTILCGYYQLKPSGLPIQDCVDGPSWSAIWLRLCRSNNNTVFPAMFFFINTLKATRLFFLIKL